MPSAGACIITHPIHQARRPQASRAQLICIENKILSTYHLNHVQIINISLDYNEN